MLKTYRSSRHFSVLPRSLVPESGSFFASILILFSQSHLDKYNYLKKEVIFHFPSLFNEKWNEGNSNKDSVQFSSVTQSCLILCDPVNHSTPGLPVHHQLPEFTQTHLHQAGDAIQPSHPLSSPSPTPNLSQHQGLFQWVNSSHEVAKVLEFQLQHQSFQWTPRTDLL